MTGVVAFVLGLLLLIGLGFALLALFRYAMEQVQHGLQALPGVVAAYFQLFDSGGLDLLVEYEPRELKPRTRTILEAIQTGGLSLLVEPDGETGRSGIQAHVTD